MIEDKLTEAMKLLEAARATAKSMGDYVYYTKAINALQEVRSEVQEAKATAKAQKRE